MEEFSHWYTPAHVMGLWDHQLRREGRGEGKSGESVAESREGEQPTLQVMEAKPEERVEPAHRQKMEGEKRQLSLF